MSGSARRIIIQFLGQDSSLSSTANAAGGNVSSLGKKLTQFGKQAAAAFALAAAASAVFLFKVGAPYVDALNKIQTLTEATDAQMKRVSGTLEKNASMYARMGMTTGDAAAGVVELTKAGMSLDQAMKAVNATMVLAKAGEMEVAEASTLVSNTLNTFNLKATQAGEVANVLANAANISSADVSDMAQALSMASNVAAGAGASIQETAAMLAELANAGMKGSDAGTSLKTMLLALQAPTTTASNALKDLGVSAFTAAGKARPIRAVLGDLDKKFKGLTDKERAKKLKDIFGSDAYRAAKVIFGNGAAALDKYTKAVDKAGAAQRLAESSSAGLAGTINMFKANATSLAQSLYREFSPAVDRALRPAVEKMGELSTKVGPGIKTFAREAAAALGPLFTQIQTGVQRSLPAAREVASVLRSWADAVRTHLLPMVTRAGSYLASTFGPVLKQFAGIITTQVIPTVSALARFFMTQVVPVLARTANTVGKKLKPTFDQLATTYRTQVLPTVSKAMAKFEQWRPTIQKVTLVVAKIIGKLIEFNFTVLGKVLPPLIRFAGFMIGKVFPVVGSGVIIFGRMIGILIDVGRKVAGAGQAFGRFASAVKEKISTAIGHVRSIPGKITGILGGLGGLLYNAGIELLSGFASGIRDKMGDVVDEVVKGLDKIKGLVPGSPIKWGPLKSWNNGGAGKRLMGLLADGIRAGGKGVTKAGKGVLSAFDADVLAGIVKGIDKHKIKLGDALDRVRDHMRSKMDRLKSLLDARNSFAEGFQGFTTSLFSADFTDPETGESTASVASILKFQEQAKQRARQLKEAVKKLINRGLSSSLLTQLQGSGESGIAQIMALASATKGQIAQLNRDNSQTTGALTAAGMAAGNAIYGDKIYDAQRDTRQAERIENALLRALQRAGLAGKDRDKVEVYLEGQHVHTVLIKHKRKTGHNLGLA
jgi:TP901 family phage tail tape measure protein